MPTDQTIKRGFAQRLKQARIAAGYEHGIDLARALGVDGERYAGWERGRTEPDISHIYRILALTHVSADFLVTGTLPPPATAPVRRRAARPAKA